MTSRRSPSFIRFTLAVMRPYFAIYHRVEYRGFDRLGSPPFLVILNHNSGAAIEPLLLLDAWERRYRGEAPGFGLAHRFGFRIPPLRALLEAWGALPATYESARGALRSGHALAIFPGGNYEACRPWWQRRRCDFGGKKGWARIAREENLPVVPVAIRGSHDSNPVLLRSRLLATLLITPRLAGVRWFHISLGQIASMGVAYLILHGHIASDWLPFWMLLAFGLGTLWSILPVKITLTALAPIHPREHSSEDSLYATVTSAIEAELRK